MRLINSSLWMRVLSPHNLPWMGLGHMWSKGYRESLFLLWQKVSRAKQSEISSELIDSSQGTPYCPRYLLVKVSSTATSLKALLTQRASTNLLSIPLIVCNPFQPP